MKTLSLRIFAATTLFVFSLIVVDFDVYAQCPPNCSSTKKTVNIYWVDLGVNWSQPAQPAQPAVKNRAGQVIRPEIPAVPALKFGDSLSRLGGPTMPSVPKEGEIAVPMPADKPMTRAELNQLKEQITQLVQQKIDQGVTKIELRAVQDITLLKHVAESKAPKYLDAGLHQRQKNLEEISGITGQALAKVKFSNSEKTKVEISAIGGSNGARTIARTISTLGHNVVDHLILDSSRGKVPETDRAVKTVGADRTTIIITRGDAPGQKDTVANHKGAEKIADQNPGVTLLYTNNTKGTSLNPGNNHITNTAPGERSFEVKKYAGNGKYEQQRIAGKAEMLLDATRSKSESPVNSGTANNVKGGLGSTAGNQSFTGGASKSPKSSNSTTTSASALKPGGILLDKAASFLGDLNDITGAAFDSRTQQVILIGKKNLLSPPMNKDHFATALRAIYSGEAPAVSIDPTDNPNVMQVRYFGQIANTEFGNILFEADRILKILSMGKDNLTGRPVRSGVYGYQNVLDRDSRSGYENGGGASYRFWFKPKELEMQKSASGDSIRYTRASIECLVVKNESSAVGTTSQAFVDHLNQHYEEFAKEFQPLQQLTQLAKIVGFAFWLRERNIQIDLASLGIKSANTPSTTPATVASSAPRSAGVVTWTSMITGGVDFSKSPSYRPDVDQSATFLGTTAMKARPDDPSIAEWNFSANGESLIAVALPVIRKPMRQIVIPSGMNLSSTDGPKITSFSLDDTNSGLRMTIYGANFGQRDRTCQVIVNSSPVTIDSWTNDKIVVELSEEASEYSISVARRSARSAPLRIQTAPNPVGIIKRIRNSQYSSLPPLTASRGSGGQTSITIQNGTPYNLRVSIVGPTVRLVTVPAGRSANVDLQVGTYEAGFQALGGNVVPLYNVWQINAGTTYTLQLSIR